MLITARTYAAFAFSLMSIACSKESAEVCVQRMPNLSPSSTFLLSATADWGNFSGLTFTGGPILYRVLDNSANTAPLPTVAFESVTSQLGVFTFNVPLPRDESLNHQVGVVDPLDQGGVPFVSLSVKHDKMHELDPDKYQNYLAENGITDVPGDVTEYYSRDGVINVTRSITGEVEVAFDVVLTPVPGDSGPEITLVGSGSGKLAVSCANLVVDFQSDFGSPGEDEFDSSTTAEQWEYDPGLESSFCQTFASWL